MVYAIRTSALSFARSFSFFQLYSDHRQLFIFKANIWFLLCCPINVLDIQFFLWFSNTGFVFHGQFLHRHTFCFTGNLKTKILGCKKIFTLKMNCYMRHIAVESTDTRYSTRGTVYDTFDDSTRRFCPFFCRILSVFTVYIYIVYIIYI